MFITKIIIDGFKSYGRKVELTGFDDSFNAITGFNGSGKSNILDAIVFVLGLSKLEMARCHSLLDLIYKNGQTGVTTASVTLEIDNSDDKFQHTEYRDSKKIVVRREVNIKNQSKYFIDGFSVTRERLLDFFQAVSLNIQNPHFLIMQGKIVKTSAAKPAEILGMVEEAVGIGTYENKKKQNLAKIAKCDKTLEEIKEKINNSILPNMKQLREEEQMLTKYHEVKALYEKNVKILTAYCYLKDKAIVDNAAQPIEDLNEQIHQKGIENAELDKEHKKVSQEMKDLQSKLSEEMGGNLKELEADLAAKRTIKERISTEHQIRKENIQEEQNKANKLKKNFDKENKTAEQKKKDYENAQKRLESLREENTINEANLARAEEIFRQITLGLRAGQEGDNSGTLAQQVMAAQDELAAVEASENKSKLVIQNTERDVAQKKQQIRSDKDSYEKAKSQIEIHSREAEVIQSELERINFDEERYTELKTRITDIKNELKLQMGNKCDLKAKVPPYRFKYDTPNSSFDQEDVIGVACKHFTVKRPELHALAVEKVCGGRLWNIIVATEKVAKDLLNRGNLRERRTFLPLNKIQGRSTDMKALRIAERLVGKENVNYAINLVTYDRRLEGAMKYIFGDTLVCSNIDMAKKVAFADGVLKRTVTFEGEIFEPNGTLTGGSVQSKQLLNIIAEIKRIKSAIHNLNLKLQQDDEEFSQLNAHSKQYTDQKAKLELKIRQVDLLKQNLSESNHHVLMEEIEQMENTIKQEQQNIAQCIAKKGELTARIKDLQDKMNNAEANREKDQKEAQNGVKTAKKLYDKSTTKLQQEEQNFEVLSQEIKHIEETLAALQEQLTKLQHDIASMNEELNQLDGQIEDAEKEIKAAEGLYNKCQERLHAKSTEIRKLQNKLDLLQKEMEDNDTTVKSLKHQIEKVNIDIKEAANTLRNCEAKNLWIREEKESFTNPESEYQIILQSNFDPKQFADELKQLKKDQTAMGKTVNLKATTLQGEKQKECEELQKKQDIIVSDRAKLQKYIDKVEKEKNTALQSAWERINEFFGQIFSTFLPYANCKLSPVTRNNIRDGLEIKVCFGTVWKESLSELSGGQRSLVALSLVLALLRYNPAPLYILDEVDAALDQSHTQNIGIMIKKYFKNSQFIIVSLKDDMFNNANVLYQTKFIDGFSTVSRRALQ